ncbi:hypothetical protein HDZ31DRAFT_69478 [Schizophyllum fasciatum]
MAERVESVLEESLTGAFDLPPTQPPAPEPQAAAPEEPAFTPENAPPAQPDLTHPPADMTEEEWKAQYDAYVASWKAQSAEAREKAEKERQKWEEIRAAERAASGSQAESLAASSAWEQVSNAQTQSAQAAPASPSPADVRDLVAGEFQKQWHATSHEAGRPEGATHTTQPTEDDNSQKWENVPSDLTSSYPSMTFPELHTDTSSPEPREVQVRSASLDVFNASLPPQSRAVALFSALAINLFLPFVNGVMLGFGELFAKNVVFKWFGWAPSAPGSTAANAGLRTQNSPFRR